MMMDECIISLVNIKVEDIIKFFLEKLTSIKYLRVMTCKKKVLQIKNVHFSFIFTKLTKFDVKICITKLHYYTRICYLY